MRKAVLALALFGALACGKYGPPVRSVPAPPAITPAVSVAPAPADTEECPDPNAPGQAAGSTP